MMRMNMIVLAVVVVFLLCLTGQSVVGFSLNTNINNAPTTTTTTTRAQAHRRQQQRHQHPSLHHRHGISTTTPSSSTRLYENNNNKKQGGGLDEGVRSKLLTETIAPWRAVRLYFYGGLGIGAFVGGLITLSGVVAAVSGARTDLDLPTEYKNLAIDFGAAAVFAALAKLDTDKGKELDERVEERMAQKAERKEVTKAMRERERTLGALQLEIQLNADGSLKKQASVKELQAGAKQHVIIVAGPKKACRDALVGANLLKMDFAMKNVLVVPYETDSKTDPTGALTKPSGGFGDSESNSPAFYETQPYVARPTVEDADGWSEYITEEMDDAVLQNGILAKNEGIAIVIANNGKVLRRGVGKVPWRQMVEELEDAVKN